MFQVSLPLFELLVTKSNSLQCHLVSTISALSTFLDTLQSLADNASNSKGKVTQLRFQESGVETLNLQKEKCLIEDNAYSTVTR